MKSANYILLSTDFIASVFILKKHWTRKINKFYIKDFEVEHIWD